MATAGPGLPLPNHSCPQGERVLLSQSPGSQYDWMVEVTYPPSSYLCGGGGMEVNDWLSPGQGLPN